MEELLINVDSRYRDRILYPSETKYRMNLEKTYKNIISARMVSMEITNTINYIDSKKNNNWFKLHLPNKINDPEGIILQLEDGLLQVIGSIKNIVNILFDVYTNTNGGLQQLSIDFKPYAEKYFYFFYLNDAVTFTFDFNSAIAPSKLSDKLTINPGWHSIYGIAIQLNNYVKSCYFIRKDYVQSNPTTPVINLDSGNYKLNDFNFRIWDRRFRSLDITQEPTANDCIRIDTVIVSDVTFNINDFVTFKNRIYLNYISNISTYIPSDSGTGILDRLIGNTYIIPSGYVGANGTTTYSSQSIYNINNSTNNPTTDSTQIYHLQMVVNYLSYTVSFENEYTTDVSAGIDYFFYWVDPFGDTSLNTWNNVDYSTSETVNRLANLTSKNFLRTYKFITEEQLMDPYYNATLEKDLAAFEIDFNTYTDLVNPVYNGLVDIKKMQYPPLGFYLGYRADIQKLTDKFLLSPIYYNTKVSLKGSKVYSTSGDTYMFLKINDWGYIDFFNSTMFAKILISTGLGNASIGEINKEYRFRQPINIQRLDVELVDYLGNSIDLNGFDWSFTLELKVLLSSDQKEAVERQNLVFVKK